MELPHLPCIKGGNNKQIALILLIFGLDFVNYSTQRFAGQNHGTLKYPSTNERCEQTHEKGADGLWSGDPKDSAGFPNLAAWPELSPPATRNLQRAPVAASHRPCSANMRNIWEATPLAEATISGQRVAGIDLIKLNKKNRRGHLNDRNNQSSGKKTKGISRRVKNWIPTHTPREISCTFLSLLGYTWIRPVNHRNSNHAKCQSYNLLPLHLTSSD